MIFHWIQIKQMVGSNTTWFTTACIAFFVGFLCYGASTLQPRRKLLLGRLEPTAEEWQQLSAKDQKSFSVNIWLPALRFAVLMALLLTATHWCYHQFVHYPAYHRRLFQFQNSFFPALGAMIFSRKIAFHSVKRFVSAMEHQRPVPMGIFGYMMIYNVLPYSLFNSLCGIAVAFARFLPYYINALPVPVNSLSLHLFITTLIITVFVVGTARLKTRVDFLSPVQWQEKGSWFLDKAKWSSWYILIIPMVVYVALRLGFALAGVEEISTGAAIVIKVSICLLVSSGCSFWAVAAAIQMMKVNGLDGHPYPRVFRIIRQKF